MFLSSLRRLTTRALSSPRQAGRGSRKSHLRCEELEPRLQPAVFFFSTNAPDGLIATIAEPANAHNSQVEFESADDFVLTTETKLASATFTGLLTGGATLGDVSNVSVEIYRVFPNDSDLNRTPQVPTRMNSPSDVALEERDSADGQLHFDARVLSNNFTAQSSVSSANKISVGSGGNGAVSGREVQYNVIFRNGPLDLPAGHYFFVPKVGLSDEAPDDAHFLWLSAPKPIVAPGTPFLPDLQSWMRDDPNLAPDWLRIGTDIIGNAAFNASFSLSGRTVPPKIASLSQTSATEGSPDLTITLSGSNFTTASTVLINGQQTLATTFVNAGQLQAVIPASFLADQGSFKLSVSDAQSGASNSKNFTVRESIPVVIASATQGQVFQQIILDGSVIDPAVEDHQVKINWGDGTTDVLDLGVSAGGTFTASHTFAASAHLHHDTIVVTALDDEGVASTPLTIDVIV
jgi:hypothetical protein